MGYNIKFKIINIVQALCLAGTSFVCIAEQPELSGNIETSKLEKSMVTANISANDLSRIPNLDNDARSYLMLKPDDRRPVVLDFWATWCIPCLNFSPIFNEVAVRYGSDVNMIQVNYDKNQGFASKFGIRSLPTVLIFNGDGAPAYYWNYPPPKSELEKAVRDVADAYSVKLEIEKADNTDLIEDKQIFNINGQKVSASFKGVKIRRLPNGTFIKYY